MIDSRLVRQDGVGFLSQLDVLPYSTPLIGPERTLCYNLREEQGTAKLSLWEINWPNFVLRFWHTFQWLLFGVFSRSRRFAWLLTTKCPWSFTIFALCIRRAQRFLW